jgi:hypothetical protein
MLSGSSGTDVPAAPAPQAEYHEKGEVSVLYNSCRPGHQTSLHCHVLVPTFNALQHECNNAHIQWCRGAVATDTPARSKQSMIMWASHTHTPQHSISPARETTGGRSDMLVCRSRTNVPAPKYPKQSMTSTAKSTCTHCALPPKPC